MTRHADRRHPHLAPGRCAKTVAALDFIDGKTHVGHANQKLLQVAGFAQPVHAVAQDLDITAGVLQMQHHIACGLPSLAPGVAAFTAAAQAV